MNGTGNHIQYFVITYKAKESEKKKCMCVCVYIYIYIYMGFPGSQESACNAGVAGDVGSLPDWEDYLEEGMATHSSILAWRILWTEEPGKLQSMGSQRVRHN